MFIVLSIQALNNINMLYINKHKLYNILSNISSQMLQKVAKGWKILERQCKSRGKILKLFQQLGSIQELSLNI